MYKMFSIALLVMWYLAGCFRFTGLRGGREKSAGLNRLTDNTATRQRNGYGNFDCVESQYAQITQGSSVLWSWLSHLKQGTSELAVSQCTVLAEEGIGIPDPRPTNHVSPSIAMFCPAGTARQAKRHTRSSAGLLTEVPNK